MQIDDELTADDADSGNYRLLDLVHSGRSRQVVRCRETQTEEDAAARAIAFPADDEEDGIDADQRREGLHNEERFLDEGIEGVPKKLDAFEVDTADGGREPVLFVDWIERDTVYDRVAKRPPGTYDAETALATVRELAGLLERVHEAGWVLRDIDPRHLAGAEDPVFVGTGNPTELDEEPVRGSMVGYADAPYVAPEVRNEFSGETLRPHADVYGLAALLSYMLTGVEPIAAVESPLTTAAYQRLGDLDPDGLRRLVAAGLQPVAKNRVADLDWWRRAARPEGLPETGPDGESLHDLPAPWSGAHPPEETRAARSSLSPGPLISVDEADGDGAMPTSAPPGSSSGEDSVVETDPVREFLGKSGDDADTADNGDDEGEPEGPREISMLEENLGGAEGAEAGSSEPAESPEEAESEAEYWERRAAESPLPPLKDLPFRYRLLIGVVIPLVGMIGVMVLGLMGII